MQNKIKGNQKQILEYISNLGNNIYGITAEGCYNRLKELSKKIVPLINLQKGNLNIELGTEDAAFTAIASSIVSIFIAVALPYVADVEKYKNYNYKITPIYLNKNVFFLQFSCIITIKLLHIFKVICKS